MDDTLFWAIRAPIAVAGAVVAWKSHRAYRQRRRDPLAPPDRWADRWWRVLFIALTVFLMAVGVSYLAPRSLFDLLSYIILGSMALVFLAAAAIGLALGFMWRP